ncbi:uncharacterized protein DUF1311 [Chthoniobacter flavus]|nr:uncharacterized protein DUF1311 [Chthoniobacter flavus]
MCATRVFLFVISSLLGFAIAPTVVSGAEDGWPEGYVIAENSQSPNDRYGVLIPGRETGADLDEDKIVNKLVDLKTHKRLCVIRGAFYFEGQNHHGLKVKWAPDSSWCVVTYEDRYGFGSIALVEIAGTKCIQSDLGGEIQKSMDAVISRESHKVQTEGYGDAFFRQGPGRTVLVRGTAYTNPKAFEDQPTNHARFEGTFDLAAHKWVHSSATGLDDWDSLTEALLDQDEPTEGTDEEKLKWFDDRLNAVYKAVRAVLPAKRFAALKNEQRDWVKQLEAQKSPADKIKLMRPRIAQLRDLLW